MPSARMMRCGAVVALAACTLVQGPTSAAADADPQADATALVSPGTDQPITTGLLPGDRFYVRYRLTSRQQHPVLVEAVDWRVTTSNPACDKYFPVVARSVREQFPSVVAPHGQLDAGDNATFEYSSAAASTCQSIDIYAAATVTAVRVPSTTTVTGGDTTLGAAGQFTATVDSAWRQTPGTVQFVVDGRDYGAPAPVLNGRAELASTALVAGTHVVLARYTPTEAGPEGSVSRPAAFHVTTDAPVTAPSPAPSLVLPVPVPVPVPVAVPAPAPAPSLVLPVTVPAPVPDPAPSLVLPVTVPVPVPVPDPAPSLALPVTVPAPAPSAHPSMSAPPAPVAPAVPVAARPAPAPAPTSARPVPAPAPALTPSTAAVAPVAVAPVAVAPVAAAPVLAAASPAPAATVARPMPAPVSSGVHAAPVAPLANPPGRASALGVPPWRRPDPRRAIG